LSELALSGSLISALGGSSSFVQKLNELGVTIHKGATVFYKSSEIEFTFHFNMGPISTRVDTILKHVKSFLAKPLEFENIIDIHGYGLTPSENLREMGIIQIEGNKATVDFGKILKELKSNLVILTVRTKLNERITQALLSVHIDKNPQHEGDKITSANIEAVLDYANLWHKDFDQFNVRDIQFSFNLEIYLDTIIQEIPYYQRKKIIQAAKAISKGIQDAISYMKIVSDNFLNFEDESILTELEKTVTIEPTSNFQLKAIIPRMQSCEIAAVSHPIILPGFMKILLECRLEGRDIVLNGKISIDLEKFKKILKKIMTNIEKETKGLKF